MCPQTGFMAICLNHVSQERIREIFIRCIIDGNPEVNDTNGVAAT